MNFNNADTLCISLCACHKPNYVSKSDATQEPVFSAPPHSGNTIWERYISIDLLVLALDIFMVKLINIKKQLRATETMEMVLKFLK